VPRQLLLFGLQLYSGLRLHSGLGDGSVGTVTRRVRVGSQQWWGRRCLGPQVLLFGSLGNKLGHLCLLGLKLFDEFSIVANYLCLRRHHRPEPLH
jgi:hypothetical protein